MEREMSAHERLVPRATGTGDLFAVRGKQRYLLILMCMLLCSIMLSLALGAYAVSLKGTVSVLVAHLTPFGDVGSLHPVQDKVIWNLRFPRILVAIVVGVSLSVSGAVFQSVFRNPLVEPYILGVSSGSAFGAACSIVFPTIFFSVQGTAFLFGSVAVGAAYALSRVRGDTPVITLVLSGVIIGSVFSSFVSILKYVASDTALRDIVFWLMGGFYYASWDDVFVSLPIVTLSILFLWSYGWKLNILSMGDEEARCLGVNPEHAKLAVVSVATLLTAYAVSLAGIIAWVGLMMPHAARLLFGPDNRYVLPASALMGAIYLIVCDTIARTVASAEIPVGIIASILGAPYLCYLLRNKGRVIYG